MAAERLTHHHIPVIMADELWHLEKTEWAAVPEHVLLFTIILLLYHT